MSTRSFRFVCLSALFLLMGCFNTKGIQSGGLICGDKGSCPDGFTCDKSLDPQGRCYKSGEVQKTSNGDAGLGSDGAGASCQTPLSAQWGPFPGCTVKLPTATSSCDPVCQSGCPCDKRCITDNDAKTYFCELSTPAEPFAKHMEKCKLTSNSNAASSCTPGAFCLEDGSKDNSVCGSLCYQTCRVDSDCPATTRCTANRILPADSTVAVSAPMFICSPHRELCNPIGTNPTCLGSKGAGFACVLMASLTGGSASDEATCDCKAPYTIPIGGACLASNFETCVPGSVCVSGTCRQLCLLNAGTGCPSKECQNPFSGSTKYGWCN